VIKFNFIAGGDFDYRKIRWIDAGAEAPPPLPALSAGEAETPPAPAPPAVQEAQ